MPLIYLFGGVFFIVLGLMVLFNIKGVGEIIVGLFGVIVGIMLIIWRSFLAKSQIMYIKKLNLTYKYQKIGK